MQETKSKLDEANKKLKATQSEIETAKKDFQAMIKQYQVSLSATLFWSELSW